MADYLTDDTELTAIADAIREKGGTSAELVYPDGFVTAIGNISGGGGTDTSDATMTSGDQMLSGVTAYSKGTKYTGTIPTKTSSNMTTSGATVTAPAGYYASDASTSVDSMTLPTSTAASASSGYSSKATVSRSTSDQYINIPTGYNSAGAYYKINAVANGAVTAPSTISGTSATVSTGTNTLTLTKTVSVTPNVTTAGYISSGTAGNSNVSLTASVTTKAAATITPGTSNQTINSGTYLTGTQTISGDSNLTAGNIKKNVSIFGVTGSYEGSGGGGGLTVATATATPSSASASISFTNLAGEPTSFIITSAADLATGASPYKTSAVVFDGTNLIGQEVTNTSNAQVTYVSSGWSKSYSSGTLTVTGTGTNFQANQYKLIYTYGGSDINTVDVQVGSGATSITFTGLEEEPSYFSCLFKSNFSTSSGYTRTMVVAYDGTDTYGMEMGSGGQATTHWSFSYSSGSLTISSQSTTAGGYFHQPGYYQLTYATEGSSGNYQTKTVTPTAAGFNVTADSGYDALKKVVVEGDADLVASNIKSGVTIFNVLGTYDSGGGGSVSVDTKTATNSDNTATSIQFTSMKGTPKYWFLRTTTQISSSGSTSYYYVVNMRYNGSNTTGNCFRIGSTRRVDNITSGYSYSYSGTTLTISSTGSRTASPGSFYNGTYELVYIY